MSKKSLNLIYSSASTTSFNFFKHIKSVNQTIIQFKKGSVINDFDITDETEIGRGRSYAVFPELREQVKRDEKITVNDFRASLCARGITDITFQNKILSLVLQNKAGLQYAFGNIFTDLLLSNKHDFLMASGYKLKLEVKDEHQIKLIFSGNWRDIYDPDTPALNATVQLDMTPDKVTIEQFNITQLSNSPSTDKAFDFLEQNQANIFEKFIIFLKNIFGINSDAEIENVYRDQTPWNSNTKTINDASEITDESDNTQSIQLGSK